MGIYALVGREGDVRADDKEVRMGSMGKLGNYATQCMPIREHMI